MSIYDGSGQLQSPKIDARLHEYWVECQLYRRSRELDSQQFSACMTINSEEPSLPVATRMKILKFTGARAV